MTLQQLRDKRATLLREAEALKGADGSFKDDATRTAFDGKMADIDALDGQIRALETSAPSQTMVERNPLDPGAPTTARTAATPKEPNDHDRGVTAERVRAQGILTACRAARLPQAFADDLIARGLSLVEAQGAVFDEMGKRGGDDFGPGRGPSVSMVGVDPLVHMRAGIENALLHRVAPQFFKLEERGKAYRGLTLLETAKIYLQARGERTTNLHKLEIAGMALGMRGGMHTTSDFPFLLADIASKTLRRAYDEYPVTYTPFVRVVTVPDFKTVNRVQLGDAPALEKVLEHGEFTRGTISEGKEAYSIGTWGRIFAITRQALINDDTAAFTRVPVMFGRSVRTLESNLVWEQITSNPIMGDGFALFSPQHGNISGTDGEISIATLGEARAALRMQTSIDGQRMNITAKYLLVPTALETLADQYTAQIQPVINATVNPFSGKLTVIAEPRLDADSPDAWYVAASPDTIDIIELAYLEGQDGPMVESRIGFDVDGLEIKCRHDVAAKVIEHRGLFKNQGDT